MIITIEFPVNDAHILCIYNNFKYNIMYSCLYVAPLMNYKNKGRNIVDVKEVQKRLGLRLRELRLAKNLRQEDLEKWNFSYRYYGMIERGLINPSLDTLFKLSTIFDVSLHELFRFLEIEGVTTDEREAVAIIISKILKENKKAKIKKLKIFLEEILTP